MAYRLALRISNCEFRIKSPLRTLLDELFDYAGLFPPASLSMTDAVREYAAHREEPHAWMLSRFVLPAGRLPEFELTAPNAQGWRLSAIVGADVARELRIVTDFNARGGAGVDTVELKAETADCVRAAAALIPRELTAYVEVRIDTGSAALVDALAEIGLRAKIRAGGAIVPPASDLAAFILACKVARVPFKATAGLHHPLRSRSMHGFLNLTLASAFICAGMDSEEALDLLEETSAEEIRFTDSGVTWRGRTVANDELASARRFLIAIGSCSFREPVEDLERLGLL